MKRQKHTLEEVKAHYKACAKSLAGQTLDWQSIKEVLSIKDKIYNKISPSKLVEIGILIPRYIVKRTVRAGKGFTEKEVQFYSVRVEDANYLELWKELKRLRERNVEYAKKSTAKKRSIKEISIEPVVEEISEVQVIPALPEPYNDLYEAIQIIKKYGGKVIFE